MDKEASDSEPEQIMIPAPALVGIDQATTCLIDNDLRVLCDGDELAINILQSLEISSAIVFANFWDAPQEMMEELLSMGMNESRISKIAKFSKSSSSASARAEAVNLP